jgi:hypothetical protein
MMIRRALGVAIVLSALSAPLAAQLFSKPLHLTRSIEDPISKKKTTIDEYFGGNRSVAISGTRTVIFDYSSSEITTIDRAAGTFSVMSFEAFAASRSPQRVTAKRRDDRERWTVRQLAPAAKHGRIADIHRAKENVSVAARTVDVATDRQIELTEEAFDAITGARYPGHSSDELDIVKEMSRTSRGSAKSMNTFALPLSTDITYSDGNESITLRNEVIAVAEEVPPPYLLEIPAGAKRVEPRTRSIEDEMRELDSLPSPTKH